LSLVSDCAQPPQEPGVDQVVALLAEGGVTMVAGRDWEAGLPIAGDASPPVPGVRHIVAQCDEEGVGEP